MRRWWNGREIILRYSIGNNLYLLFLDRKLLSFRNNDMNFTFRLAHLLSIRCSSSDLVDLWGLGDVGLLILIESRRYPKACWYEVY